MNRRSLRFNCLYFTDIVYSINKSMSPQRLVCWCIIDPPDACFPSAPQAAGYGVVEFAKCVLEDKGDTLKGKRCLITGSGKVSGVMSEALQLDQLVTCVGIHVV